MKTSLYCGDGNTLWVAALSPARPPSPRVLRTAEAATVSSHAPSPGLGTPSTVLVSARLFTSQSYRVPVRADTSGGENSGVSNQPAELKVALFVGSPDSLHLVHSRSPSEAESVEFLMREFRSACFVLNRRAPKTVLDLDKMSLWWPRELLGQERTLQRRHVGRKPEMGEVTKIKVGDEKVVVYGEPGRSRGTDANK